MAAFYISIFNHEYQYTNDFGEIIERAVDYAHQNNLQFVTPEVLVFSLLHNKAAHRTLRAICGKDETTKMYNTLELLASSQHLMEPPLEPGEQPEAEWSHSTMLIFEYIHSTLQAAAANVCDLAMLLNALLNQSPEEVYVAYLLKQAVGSRTGDLLEAASRISAGEPLTPFPDKCPMAEFDNDEFQQRFDDYFTYDDDDDEKVEDIFSEGTPDDPFLSDSEGDDWKSKLLCVNDIADSRNPLVGRQEELLRTLQVMCRKDKNNPLHVGEPGVGKTALVYGLAQMINRGEVPEPLSNCRIYLFDISSMLAGTQYRGEFEKRLEGVLKGAEKEGNVILYIDEIHNIVGAGQIGDNPLDAGNILKPYLERGTIRFIGSTTHEEYNRHLSRSKGLLRRFQTINIEEPTTEQAIEILRTLRPQYEAFHGVTYTDEALRLAVEASAKHINDRYLPDKAIDLMDEAGAMLRLRQQNSDNGESTNGDATTVDEQVIARVLARVAKVDALEVRADDTERLRTLQDRILEQIYGQDKAVADAVQAVQMAKAGLTDDGKPLASMLFVGPTGVGKTEVARVLAKQLDVELVRFDMSEYVEKHTVAKLIGSPAGYVGYEDGGLLTDAVRRSPDCVLLLDEIEKAHPDVFNILLQVMDYGVLTDNKGRKAHFRNVVLIMTSNAGARYAHQASVGFASATTTGSAMLSTVKKTFKPEFINRLTSIVVFNDMDRQMASLVLDKKMRELYDKLAAKNVTVELTEAARELLLNRGFSAKYGAREMDRVIRADVKTLLMREILFGALAKGGHALLTLNADGELAVEINPTKP